MLGGNFGCDPGWFVLTEQLNFLGGGEMEDVLAALVFFRQSQGELGSI